MDVLSSGLTAAFLGVILALVRVVDWLIKRRSDDKKPVAQSYNGLGRVNDRLIEMKGSLDGIKERMAEANEDYREISKEMSEVKSVHERLGDKVDNLSSKIDKLEPLPAQMGRLADAITALKDEIRKQ
jgi:chromosome segregation ATPase